MIGLSQDVTNDSSLLLQIEQGSSEAFNILYERHWASAYANAYKRLKDADEAKNIVQEIFVNIWVRRGDRIDNFPAYLNIAVRNRVYKLVEKKKCISPFLDTLENITTINQNADDNILWKEFYKSYEALLTTLPQKRQQIFRLRYHEDQTTKDIAERMGISRKTVQNQLGKAIEQLRLVLFSNFIFIITLITCWLK
jgi:RNA polymerase sigma-70 factor (family 1)